MNKIYYELNMTAQSPLRIGGGGNEETDNDLLLDGKGVPFIPGSSIAGILRSLCASENDKRSLFGDVIIANNDIEAESVASRVLVSDGCLVNDNNATDIFISRRDGVGLDQWGMAIKGAKYDFQIAEIKGVFKSIIECNFETEEQKNKFDSIMAQIVADGMLVGARTTRGYGSLKCKIRKRIFEFPQDIESWLNFNAFAEDAFLNAELVEPQPLSNQITEIKLFLNLEGNLTVRVKEANAVVREDGTNPDDVTLKNNDGLPVIPGTSWAGSFRHHMIEVNRVIKNPNLTEETINRLFGKGIKANDSTKSLVTFSESVVWGGESVITMRNSVDRFTAAPTNGALFTTESWNGGETELCITFPKDRLTACEKQLLACCIMDLNVGIMSIGGGAGVGKGLVSVKKITVNGIDKTSELGTYTLEL